MALSGDAGREAGHMHSTARALAYTHTQSGLAQSVTVNPANVKAVT